MEINMNYYKKDLYEEIYEYPKSMNSIRKNLLNWYPFKENATVLEIGANCGEITKFLCDNCRKVTTIEFSKKKAEKIQNSIKEKDNLEIIIGNLEDIKLEEKFDYIILIGTLEYANLIIKDKKNPEYELINYCKSKLNTNGTLLIAVDNKMGVKYLSGAKSKHCEKVYDSIKDRFYNGKLFSKRELDKLIEKIGMKHKRYFYPLPNYEVPNLIITEEFLVKSVDSKLNYNFVYDEGSLVVQDEVKLLKHFINNDKFAEYTNSYLIELSDEEINRKIKYISFNNMRKDKYSLILKMYNETIEKIPKEDVAQEQILRIKENAQKLKELGFEVAEETQTDNTYIKSKFIYLEQLDQYIVNLIENEKIDEAYEIIEKWYKYIKEKLKPDETGNVEYGFLDLVFENFFYDELNSKFIVFDQEWVENNINIDYILFIAINNLFAHHSKLEQKLNKEKILEKYKLIEKQEEYERKEMNFQTQIIDEERKKFYGEQYKYKISSEELIKITEDAKKLDRDNIELIKEVKRLDKDNVELIKEIEKLKNKDTQKEIKIEKETVLTKIKRKILKLK